MMPPRPGPHRPLLLLAALAAGCSGRGAAPTAQQAAPPARSADALGAIRTAKATVRTLQARLELVGSVAYDPDHVATVGPLVAGRLAELMAKSGTAVRRGQLLAELESPEAGQAMAQYITAVAREHAACAQLAREQELARKHISSARDLEVAEATGTQARAERHAAEELLQALGLDPQARQSARRGRVPLRSPIDGVVVQRFVTLGQAVERGTDAFFVADLSRLWIELEIYERDLGRVFVGQSVELRTESLPGQTFAAKVAFVEPTVDAKTRTTNMRLELDNTEGQLRPGQFVTARLGDVDGKAERRVLTIERTALQTMGGRDVVFVQSGEVFAARPVSVGLADDQYVEISSGLMANESVAVEGAFLLKAKQTLR